MSKRSTYGTEIITVSVQDGHADDYMMFETNLTRLLNRMYPYYHMGADIYQSTKDPNTFMIAALYSTSICYAPQMDADLEDFVAAHYAANFPYVTSRCVMTDQGDNQLLDHCYQRFHL